MTVLVLEVLLDVVLLTVAGWRRFTPPQRRGYQHATEKEL